MKFGRNLARNQVPEWASSYINYKALKKLIKNAAENVRQGGSADTAEFFFSLDRNLEDVDAFYSKRYGESARRLKLLQDRYGKDPTVLEAVDQDEVEDLRGALLELRGQLRKLQWYGEVNRRGFIKITKKLDKKVPQAMTQRPYLESKVDPKPFAANVDLLESMNFVNTWLLALGDLKIEDDGSSTSSGTMKRVASKTNIHMSAGVQDAVDHAIRGDDALTLTKLLRELNVIQEDPKDLIHQQFLLNLLQRSISLRAKACIGQLLSQITSLKDGSDINKRNCIHRLVISIGRSNWADEVERAAEVDPELKVSNNNYITPAAPPVLAPPACVAKETDGSAKLGREDKVVVLFQYLLDQLRGEQQKALQARDVYGRMPIHYAAQYGLVVVCQMIVSHMQWWDQFEIAEGIDAPFWQDSEGLAPLHLSVIGGHPLTTKTLLEAEDWRGSSDRKAAVRKQISGSSATLSLATKANAVAIVTLLVAAGVDINFRDDQGETALHVAARFGHDECARLLLDGSKDQTVDTEIAESTYGWTPLFIACVDGHLGIVNLIIDAGANLEQTDKSGWTAKEHAALRGHIEIARRLSEVTLPPKVLTSDPPSFGLSSSTIGDRKSNGAINGNGAVAATAPVKTFGHRYLTKESMILVSLGSMDMRKAVEAVKLDKIPIEDAHSTQLDTALSIVVSAAGAKGESSIIDLPVQDNVSTEPIAFTAVDTSKVKLLFDIVPTYAGTMKGQIVGRGVALLSSIKTSIGSKRINLQGDLTVPIVAPTSLEVIGSVNFNFLIITPFTHPNMSITETGTYWKSIASTMVIGHRGLGKNMAARTSLQLGENTLQSFIAAANLGASYVEFDVQLTKDHVPVIYHDFLVSETGIDAPVHTLTLEQFLHVGDGRTPRSSRPPSPVQDSRVNDVKAQDPRRHRSMSLSCSDKANASELTERMKHTKDFKLKGFKANSRGNFIQAPFTTLEEMFTKLPESIGFNIEMKYPMLHESEEQGMDTYAVELNSFVDTVLTKVYDYGKKRNVIFSSFNPDICLLLSFKQPSIPILFLTDAGVDPVGDIRASSLQEAIRFAGRWNLLGIVSAAEPLVISPRLVKVVKESGLVCVSYGTINNDPEKVKLQVQEGIDAVIVDSVLAIRKGLTGSMPAPTTSTVSATAAPSDSSYVNTTS